MEKKKRKGRKGGKPNPAADTAPLTSYNFTREESEKQAFRPGGRVVRSPLKDARGFTGEQVLTPED